MYNIFALIGKAGSGKNFILETLKSKRHSLFKQPVNFVRSVTSRPRRENESDEDYAFVTDKKFKEMIDKNLLIEWQEFREWYYGTLESDLNGAEINIGIFNISGVTQLMQSPDINVIPIVVLASDKTRLVRQLQRENNPDIGEIFRRLQTDTQDFEDIKWIDKCWFLNNDNNNHCCYTDINEGIKIDNLPSVVFQLANLINLYEVKVINSVNSLTN